MRKTAFAAILFALFVSALSASAASAASIPKTLSSNTKVVAQTTAAPKDQSKQPSNNSATPAPDDTITVQSGDTLIALAQAHQTTYQRLFDANDSISDPNVINPGQQFRVPKDDEQLPDRISTLPQTTQQTVAAAAQSYAPQPSVAQRAPAAAPVSYPSVGGNDAKAFIYSHESGNNPNATNPNGCYGLGQDCSGRVRAQCGADYACQDAYFDSYASSRYGGWDGAYQFWIGHHWW